MGSVALVVAFGLSIAPGALAWLPGRGFGLEGSSWLALALLPWLALAGLPRGRAAGAGPIVVLGLALAPLALAAGFDVAAGYPPGATARVGAWGALLVAWLALAADRGGRTYGVLWLLAVPAAAFGLHALTTVGSQPVASSPAVVLAASPLAWPLLAMEQARQGGGGAPLGALAVAALLTLAGGPGSGREASSAEAGT